MADNLFLGAAIAVRDIWTVTFGGTWVAADPITATIGSRALVVTLGSEVTLADVCIAFTNAWNALQRRDGISDPFDTSNVGGQELGEFAEYTATTDGATKVWLTANTPGKPAVINVTEGSAAGTVSISNTQVATGPNFYSNTANWSLAAVPLKTHTMVLKDSDVSILYDLPNEDELPTIRQYMSYRGHIGLPPINRDNPTKPYYEHRRQMAVFSDDGFGIGEGTRTHEFGIGEGEGSPFMRIGFVHTDDGHSNVTVYNTGQALNTDIKALDLVLSNTLGGGSVNVFKGSVRFSDDFQYVLQFDSINIAANADCDILLDNVSPADFQVTQAGGQLIVRQKLAEIDTNFGFDIRGGTCIIEDLNTTGTVALVADDGKIVWNTADSFTSLVVASNGVFDAEQELRTFDAGTVSLYQGAGFVDKYGRGDYSPGITLVRCDINDLSAFRVGQNRILSIA